MSPFVNSLYRAFDHAFRAVDTAPWINDDKLVPFMKTVDRADNHTAPRHALETSSRDDMGH